MFHFYKPQHEKNPWKIKSGQLVYENPWISVFHDEVITPSSAPGIYGTVHYNNYAIGIVPLDQDHHTWLVGQYRYPLKRWSWEIPEGGCPTNSDPLVTAQRELKEETGLTANNWHQLCTYDLSNSVSDEIGFIFVAQELTVGLAQPEECEELEVRRLPFLTIYQMVLDGRITDAVSVIGIMRTKLWLDDIE